MTKDSDKLTCLWKVTFKLIVVFLSIITSTAAVIIAFK